MSEDLISFELPETQPASIKVIGVGGGGGNAVNHMFSQGIKDVDFILCNTDSQALQKSAVPVKIQLGDTLTGGRGAGNKPEVGRESAIETINELEEILADNTQMVFITAGMGGGTGTGAAPIIAQAAKELGVLTVAIVTIPFRFEGRKRVEQALEGVRELSKHVDSILVINNEKLRQMYGNLSLSEAFSKADDVLAIAAKGIAEIITVHGMVNVDFADVQYVMKNSGVAIMGSATASGEDRARNAIEEALNSPLLNNADIRGAKDILLNISSGSEEVTMDEISEITDFIIEEAGDEVNMIWGSVKDHSLGDKISVTIIATGFEMESIPEFSTGRSIKSQKVQLDEQREYVAQPQSPAFSHQDDLLEPREKVVTRTDIPRPEAKRTEPQVERFSIDGDNQPKPESTGYYTRQTAIDFDSAIEFEVEKKTPGDIRMLNDQPTKSQIREAAVRRAVQEHPTRTAKDNNEFRYEHVRDMEDISQFENIPAYLRKKMKDASYSEEDEAPRDVSRFTLSEDEKGNPRLRDTNSFYTDLVD